MAGTELMLFLPAMMRERRSWLDDRIVASQIAVLALPPHASALLPDSVREELLRLAGVVSIRLQEPDKPAVALSPVAPVYAPALLDMRTETVWSRLAGTLASLTRTGNRLLLVVAPSPKRPEAILSIVLNEGDLDDHLKSAGASVALHGLEVAVPTGVLTYVALLYLLVRPLRRITRSIAAFRADPERSTPLDDRSIPPGTTDEVAMAERELAAMQRELRAALWRNARLAALGATVAKVSHDLRGILSPALLTAERLQSNPDPAVRRAGDSLARIVDRATSLVKHTLDFAGEVPPPPREKVPLRTIVDEAVREALAMRHATRASVEIDPGVLVHGDRQGLLRAFSNLVRNAAEAGASNVIVTARPDGDLAVITVTDDGPGLPEVVRENLFRPFVTGGKAGGAGLGLAITRDLVRAQGGDVALGGSGSGGTEFRIALRLHADAPRSAPDPGQKPAG